MILSGMKWDTPTVTVSFNLGEADLLAARSALSAIQSVCGLSFTEVESGTIHYSYGDVPFGYAGWTFYPGDSEQAGDVLLEGWLQDKAYDAYRDRLVLHETLHAVGLRHPDDGDALTIMGNDYGIDTLQDMDIQALQELYGPPAATGVGALVEAAFVGYWEAWGNP